MPSSARAALRLLFALPLLLALGACAATHMQSGAVEPLPEINFSYRNMPKELVKECQPKTESLAMDVNALKNSLMVAALSCNQNRQYNSFINRHSTALKQHEYVLKQHFSTLFGHASEKELTAFNTRIANNASRQSMRSHNGEYCAHYASLFNKLINGKSSNIPTIAVQQRAFRLHGAKSCQHG